MIKASKTFKLQKLYTQFDYYTTRSYFYRNIVPNIHKECRLLEDEEIISSDSDEELRTMGSIPFEISPIDNSQKQDLSLLFSNFSNKLTDNNASLSKVLGRYQRIGKNQVYDVIAEAKKQQFQTRRKILLKSIHDRLSYMQKAQMMKTAKVVDQTKDLTK